jgi:hypothetical protein
LNVEIEASVVTAENVVIVANAENAAAAPPVLVAPKKLVLVKLPSTTSNQKPYGRISLPTAGLNPNA